MLNREDPDRAIGGTEPPFASVVVVTKNRARWLSRALQALSELDYPAYELLVIDHSSSDATADVAAAAGARRVVAPAVWGIGRCRRFGVEEARGEVIAMCDDDCSPRPGWLSALVRRLLADPELGMVGGRVINVGFPESKRYKGRTRLVGPNGVVAFAADPTEAEFFGNANLAYRREAIIRIGSYDPFFHAGAEIDLALSFRRCGYRVAYEPLAVVEHHFTGIDHKTGRLFWSGELMRLYRHLKHSPPRGGRAWLRFWSDESRLLVADLGRAGRRAGSGLKRRRPDRLSGALVDTVNALSARAAVPWLAWRARQARHRLQRAAGARVGDGDE